MGEKRFLNSGRVEFWALMVTLLLSMLASWESHGALEQKVQDLSGRIDRIERLIDAGFRNHGK
jgi:hypothetical protein